MSATPARPGSSQPSGPDQSSGPSQLVGANPSLVARLDRTGVPLLVARVLLGFMFIWMGAAKTGYPELILKKTGHWKAPAAGEVPHFGPMELGGPINFLKLIKEYDMFPDYAWRLMNLTAVAMPWVEVLCGVLLVLGIGIRGAAGVLLALLLMFTTMIVIRGLRLYHTGAYPTFCAINFNCGCGAGNVFICRKIPENLGLIALAAITLASQAKRLCLAKNLVPQR
jgi:uncharacterized membrane protein YphA (DoxX/SURF4 family)